MTDMEAATCVRKVSYACGLLDTYRSSLEDAGNKGMAGNCRLASGFLWDVIETIMREVDLAEDEG